MPSPAPKAPAIVHGGRTIRAGIVLLAAVAFALSYDALRQMAVASHVRGLLTYLFPLVIDGFIAIGVVALLILRTAPVRSRFYVWMLVGVATGTSIAANVVHAVGLNEGTSLHLNNATAGALSAIAPLALAGAVHLYLVMHRHLAANGAMAETPATTTAKPATPLQSSQELADYDATAHSATASTAPEPEAKADTAITPAAKSATRTRQRKRTVPEEELLAIARAIGTKTGHVPRTTLEDAVRAQGYTIQKDRAKEVASAVTAELTATKDAVAV